MAAFSLLCVEVGARVILIGKPHFVARRGSSQISSFPGAWSSLLGEEGTVR